MRTKLGATSLVAIVILAACASPQPASNPVGQTAPAVRTSEPKTLTVALETEPLTLVLPFVGQFGSQGGSDLQLAVHHRLAGFDDLGALHPVLASELPSRERGSWIVRPDGTMQTTYKLRPGVTWHDGAALVANDFLFAWTVTTDPDIPTTERRVSQLVERIELPDAMTLVLDWKEPYPFANAVNERDLGPLPAHILEATYRADKERFIQSSYWTRDFVGVGPYRVVDWEPGSHLVLNAYDGFYGGRAKIDRLIVRFVSDDATAVAQLLAGAIDGDIAETVQFGQAMFVKRAWERDGHKPFFVAQPMKWRFLFTQFRVPNPPEILDVRVRRALLHALDRQELADVLVEGQAPIADSMIPPGDPKADWVKDQVVHYAYDPRAAEQLLAEVGWRRGSEGRLLNAAGQPASVSAWSQPGDTNAQELAVIANQWNAIGLGVDQAVLSNAQVRDQRYSASFPSFITAQIPLAFNNLLTRVHGPSCPSEATRWSGSSWGCYQNAEMDQTIQGIQTAIDPVDQQRLWRNLVRIHAQELPVLPLYFNVTVMLFREGVTGVKGHTIPKSSATWNVYEWDLS